MNNRRKRNLYIIIISVITAGTGDARSQELDEGAKRYDCGTIALHTLLALEGHPTSLKRITDVLRTPSEDGFSMAQLRDAAKEFGVTLLGTQLGDGKLNLDRNIIIYFNDGAHGHFQVVRPVGKTGAYVQVIDTVGDPEIVDALEFSKKSGWTGLCLVPVRYKSWIIALTAIGALMATIVSIRVVRKKLWLTG